MQAYAIGNLPLIHKLKNPAKWIQNWYADDGSCLGPFDSLKEWLQLISLIDCLNNYVILSNNYLESQAIGALLGFLQILGIRRTHILF